MIARVNFFSASAYCLAASAFRAGSSALWALGETLLAIAVGPALTDCVEPVVALDVVELVVVGLVVAVDKVVVVVVDAGSTAVSEDADVEPDSLASVDFVVPFTPVLGFAPATAFGAVHVFTVGVEPEDEGAVATVVCVVW